jgi:hypothetical protein
VTATAPARPHMTTAPAHHANNREVTAERAGICLSPDMCV